MADVQKQFLNFHENIRLSDDDGKAELATKRDLLTTALKDGLKKLAGDGTAPVLKFSSFNQGSYAMHTGTIPADGNYDIDVGVIFENSQSDFDDPVVLKKYVRAALASGNRTVEIRRPCVTVNYMKNDEIDFHVDLAVYIPQQHGELFELATGKEFSSADKRLWQISAPKQLIKTINEKFSDEDERKQYRRIIRYMKRWRDHKMNSAGAPISIALTSAAYHWFSPCEQFGERKDLNCIRDLSHVLLGQFFGFPERAVIKLPVEPYSDLLELLTDLQMQEFRSKLEELRDKLDEANAATEVHQACKILHALFGEDFPIPNDDEDPDGPKGSEVKSQKAPYITTGNSA